MTIPVSGERERPVSAAVFLNYTGRRTTVRNTIIASMCHCHKLVNLFTGNSGHVCASLDDLRNLRQPAFGYTCKLPLLGRSECLFSAAVFSRVTWQPSSHNSRTFSYSTVYSTAWVRSLGWKFLTSGRSTGLPLITVVSFCTESFPKEDNILDIFTTAISPPF